MARIEITVPGERVVEEFTTLVKRPTAPSGVKPADIGLVEISQSTPTELIPGPVGPQGPRGSRWFTGDGDPTVPGLLGDMYLDDASGDIWTWNGTAWVNTGTNLTPHPPEMLDSIKTVDGAGSGLDADLLDGMDSPYYLDWNSTTNKPATFPPTLPIDYSNISNKPATFPPTLPIPSSGVTGLDAKQASQDTAINAKVGPDAPVDGLTYGRKDAAWSTIVGGAVISDTPPPGPLTPGQLWYEADSGNTFLWYSDADSSQWVQQNIAAPVTEMPSGLTAETRNRIVNPAMQISQENGNTAGTTAGYYAADQWLTSFVTTGTIGIQRVQSVTLNGSKDRLLVQINTADTSLAATEVLQIIQRIEGNRIADFQWGSASAKQVVLRFGFRAPAGTYGVFIQNGAGNRTYLVNFVIAAGQANIDTTQTFIIPGDTTGAWLTDTGIGIMLGFGLAVGSNFHGVTGWQAGAFNGTSSNTNGMATLANQFVLSDVGLYLDPLNTGVPPRFEMPDEAEELRACQRYYVTSLYNIYSSNVTSGNTYYLTTPLPVQPRTAPTLSGVHSIVSGFPGVIGTLVYIYNGIRESRSASVTVNAGYFAQTYTANARM